MVAKLPLLIIAATVLLAMAIVIVNTGAAPASLVVSVVSISQPSLPMNTTEGSGVSAVASTAAGVAATEVLPTATTAAQAVAVGGAEVVVARSPPPPPAFPMSELGLMTVTNSDRCRNGPPVTDPIPPYRQCPLPGLNNILYSQVNRWYCAYRDGSDIELRDRSCSRVGAGPQKGAVEPYRFSSILTIDYSREHSLTAGSPSDEAAANSDGEAIKGRWGGGGANASLCWSDIAGNKQTIPPACEWSHVPRFYGTPQWWRARRMIDFHPQYYRAAAHYVHAAFGGAPFIAVHSRRGDYYTHCHHVIKQGIPPWVTFSKTPHLVEAPKRRCFPSEEDMIEAIAAVAALSGHTVRNVLVATNHPDELRGLQRAMARRSFGGGGKGGSAAAEAYNIKVVLFDDARLREVHRATEGRDGFAIRDVDRTIVEMAMLSFGSYFIFNAFSSFSGTVYEQARIHGRVRDGDANVFVW